MTTSTGPQEKKKPITVSLFFIDIQTLNPEVQLELLPLHVVFYYMIFLLIRMKTKLCKKPVLPLIRAWLALHLYLPAISELGEQEDFLNFNL